MMIRFGQYYAEYRRCGLSRLDALRFAWLVSTSGVRPIPVRPAARR
jgi:hypothetical protein